MLKIAVQYEFSAVCGAYAIVFVYLMSRNRRSKCFVKTLANSNKEINDRRVLIMYRRIFNATFCNIFNLILLMRLYFYISCRETVAVNVL